MKLSFNIERRSATFKVTVIALLVLVLLIPVGMIKNVILDRMQFESVATLDIRNSWGGDQTVTGPILRLPYEAQKTTVYGSPYSERKHAYLLAQKLSIVASVNTEIRYRGMHEVPVFNASIDMAGNFDLSLLDELGISKKDVDWSDAEVLLGISDSTVINTAPLLRAAGSGIKFKTGVAQITGLPPQLGADVGDYLADVSTQSDFSLEISVAVNGSGSLRFLPLADSAEVRASANWPSPSFVGRQLPAERDVRDDGFEATWLVSSLSRKLPAIWVDSHEAMSGSSDRAFGVRLIQPVGLYPMMLRAIKYAVLFVGLTFVIYFLMEIIGELRLHPLQYLLVGLANTLFYLLLLSLAEHVGFGLAYIVSALASATLITGYSATILASRNRAIVMATVLSGLYGFLYLTLKAESYALLAGSTGLWFILATVMYLTRKTNWYLADD